MLNKGSPDVEDTLAHTGLDQCQHGVPGLHNLALQCVCVHSSVHVGVHLDAKSKPGISFSITGHLNF